VSPAGGADLAVVIVNYNTAALLADCLGSLRSGGLDGLDAQVWVVDNGSTDLSPARAEAALPAARVLRLSANLGYAAANNVALRAAGFGPEAPGAPGAGPARHALLLNPDTLVPAGALARLVALLEAEPDLGVVGPKLLLADGTLDAACRRGFPTPEVSFYRFSGLARLFPNSRRFGRYNLTYLDPDLPADVDSVVGACLLARGRAVREVGLLDEQFWMYGEDLDWCLRFHQAGWRVAYRPEVVVHHVKRAASRGSRRAGQEFQRAMWLFYRKHYAATTPRAVHALVQLGLALRGGPALAREMWRAGSGPG
jgi:GT2 family glycosyltransferase